MAAVSHDKENDGKDDGFPGGNQTASGRRFPCWPIAPFPGVTAACDPGRPAGDARTGPWPWSTGPVDSAVDSLGRTWSVSVDACGKGL
jgi:hypothetical protein